MGPSRSIWIGYEPRETAAFAVARDSIRYFDNKTPVRGVVLSELQRRGLYTRPVEYRKSLLDEPVMWDPISDAACATEFAISRFLVPHLAKTGWALFEDCDFLARKDISDVFHGLDPKYAVYCVKHDYRPKNTAKMDGQIQSTYNKKLWSAFSIFNCDHPSNRKLTLDLINSATGRDLHAFCWLDDHEIGSLDEKWHWVPGHSSPDIDPACVHFTEGGPWFRAYENVPYAGEWRAALHRWAA